ncbi:dephospho-CoA kinase [Bacteroidaceae bacterium HV4-6-C5C]|jgi:dephospho-CoA kinase|nr:dephospho-CoA kinase [Bacteroidaceae bacterium HV4-6-C5C]
MAIKIGLTGGIGSGKSVVSRLFTVIGIPVYISDDEAKRLTVYDPFIRKELIALLGQNVYHADQLNKPLLASYVFASSMQADIVNGIIHPRVKNDFREWAGRQANPFVALESAILVEAGFRQEVDILVMVYTPKDIRIERAMKRDGVSREQIEQRVRTQMNDEEKRMQADFLIINDGETPLIPQVLQLITFLSENNGYLCHPKK